ncbi:MAG: PAS domain S-box protein, partial [Candidatus Methanoperedens sp.]
MEHIKNNFHYLEERDTQILSSTLEVIIQDQSFKNLYLEKDREKLYNYGQPLFQNLKNKYGITHFYFILPDGHDFVRLHNKEIYGDLIDRITFQKAKDTKKIASGIELGKTAFALRAVIPYYNNGELIGYVELGEDMDHIFKILKNQTNDDFAIIVDKEYLNREDWKSVRQTAGLSDNWNDLEKHLVISSTNTNNDEITAKCFVEDNLERVEKGELLLQQLQSKNQTFVCGGFSVTDARGRHIGSILSLIDITDQMAIAQRASYTLFSVAIILFISTLTTGILISRSISKPITELRNAANSIGEGNFETKIEIKSKDEIGELAASFKRMTGELQKTTVSKEYVDNIIRSIFGTLVVAAPDGTIQIVNKTACDLLGYKAEELVGQSVNVIFGDGMLQFKKPWLDELNENGSLSNIETTYLAKDGRKIPVLFSGSIMRYNNGSVQGIVCVALDITKRKQTEEALNKSRNLLDTIKSVQDNFIVDSDIKVTFNDILSNVLSLTQSEYGFIGEILYTAKGDPFLKIHVFTNIAWNKEIQEFYEKNAPKGFEFYDLNTLFGSVITGGKPVIANDPSTDARRGGLPEGHPQLYKFLGIPFYHGGKLNGMISVANRPEGYNEDII